MSNLTDILPEDEKDWILFQLMEGDLSPEEEAKVRDQIRLDPEWAFSWEQMQATRLDASDEPGLTAAQKRKLLRPSPLWSHSWQKWSVAAILFLLAGTFWLQTQDRSAPVVVESAKVYRADSPTPEKVLAPKPELPVEKSAPGKMALKRQKYSGAKPSGQTDTAVDPFYMRLEPILVQALPPRDLLDFGKATDPSEMMPDPLKVRLKVRFNDKPVQPAIISYPLARIRQKVKTELYAFSSPRLQIRRKNNGNLPAFELAFHSSGYEAVARIELKQDVLKPFNKQ